MGRAFLRVLGLLGVVILGLLRLQSFGCAQAQEVHPVWNCSNLLVLSVFIFVFDLIVVLASGAQSYRQTWFHLYWTFSLSAAILALTLA
jgi:hypothetical protein